MGVLLGNGDGTFQPAITFKSGGAFALTLAVKDLTGNGVPDIVTLNRCKSGTYSTCNAATNAGAGVLLNITRDATSVALLSSPTPSNFGQPVTLTATVAVTPGFYKPPAYGIVSFFADGKNIGHSTLSNGVVTLTTSTLSVGTHSLTATYGGNAKFASSTSSGVSQVVQGAIARFSTASVHFGNQTVNLASTAQTITLTNAGNIALTASVAIAGANAGDFSETDNCSSVAPASSCTVSVTFNPTAAGARSASVVVTDNTPTSPHTISLAGTGVLPHVTLSPTGLTFPTQVVWTVGNPTP